MKQTIEGFKLSPRQRYQWLAGWCGPEFAARCVVGLAGALNVQALRSAVMRVVSRHEILRTTFHGRPGLKVALQAIEEEPEVEWREIGLGRRKAWIDEMLAADACVPESLELLPRLRCSLMQDGPQQHYLLLRLSCLCADARSLDRLVDEVVRNYRSACESISSQDEEIVQYPQVSEWQNDLLTEGDAEAASGRSFWGVRAGLPNVVLPFELDTEGRRGASVCAVDGEFDAPLWWRLRTTAAAMEIGPELFLLSCWGALLGRLSSADEVALSYVDDGRCYEGLEGVLGPLAMALPLQVKVPEAHSFRSVLKGVEAAAVEARSWEDYLYAEDWWQGREVGSAIGFEYQEWVPPWESAGVRFSLLRRNVWSEPFKMKLCCTESAPGLDLRLEYDPERFAAGEMHRLLDQLELVAASACRDPAAPLRALDLLGEEGRRRLLVELNDTAAIWPAEASVLSLFAEHARRAPDRVALVEEERRITFGELDRRARRLAHRLRGLGAEQERVVALALERSAEVVVGILGALQAGAAYLPLDVGQPGERLASLVEESRAVAVLAEADRVGWLGLGARAVCIEPSGDACGEAFDGPLPPTPPESLAYVMFTSGSTGWPKGVAVERRQLFNYTLGVLERLSLPEGSSFATVSTFAADLGNTSVFASLCSGGCLHVVSEARVADAAAMAEYMERHRVDCLKIVPSHLEALVSAEAGRVLPRERLVLGGEASRREWVERLPGVGGCKVLNHYGPTETTVGVMTCNAGEVWGDPPPSSVPLGRPLANSRVYVLDRALSPSAMWMAGELYVSGAGLARGYLGRADLTAERFLPDLWSAEPGGRMYRTGDLVRHRPAGTIEFLGRVDGQVKLRGYRIEPGEIEAALRSHQSVAQAAVAVREDEPGDRRLVAYVVAKEEGGVSGAELRGLLSRTLPSYMVPSAFVSLRRLPLTRNGKLDRRALPRPEEASGDAGREPSAPRTPFEELLVRIWAEALRLERVGVEDNFFDLGGHSLLATRVISRIRESFGVTLPVRALFDRPTVSRLAVAIVEALRSGDVSSAPPLAATVREGPLPLSFAQQRLWFLDQLSPGDSVYNIPHAVVLTGELSVPVLWRSLAEVVRRHEVLRTTFELIDGEPVARIGAAEAPALPLVDLGGLGGTAWEEARRLARHEARRSFDLRRGPLLRVLVVRFDEVSHALLSTMHHIVSDGWSSGIMIRELSALYGAFLVGRASPLSELPIQYGDFAVWQRQWLSGEVLASQVAYWKDQLSGAPPVLDLPTDRPRPAVRQGRGARELFVLPAEPLESLRALVREQGATLFMGLLTGFVALLERYTGQEDLTVGTPIAGRTRVEAEGLIGFFTNTLVLRADLSGNPSFADQLKRMREVSLGAYAHQELPFEQLVAELAPVRDLSRTPLFQGMFVLQNMPFEALAIEGLRLESLELDSATAKFDLLMAMVERGGVLHGSIEYDTDLFDRSTVCRLAEHFRHLTDGVLADPTAVLAGLPLLAGAELHQLLCEWNDTGTPPAPACIHERVEAAAAAQPAAFAAVFAVPPQAGPIPGGPASRGSVAAQALPTALSYGELNRRANQLARHLLALGLAPEGRVALCLERSFELLVAVLAVLKAGGAYVPIDPSYPAERVAFMLDDSRVALLLSEERLAVRLPLPRQGTTGGAPLRHPLRTIWLDSERAAIAQLDSDDLPRRTAAANLAYVIYTSGSTGLPKGVAMTHGVLANMLAWQCRASSAGPGDRTLQLASLSFDVSCQEIFATWWSGGTLVLFPEEVRRDPAALCRVLRREEVARLFLPFVTLQQLADVLGQGEPPPDRLVEVMTAGEALQSSPQLVRWFADSPGIRLHNQYGPTEGHVVTSCTLADSPAAWPALPPIGRPLANVRIYLLDRDLQPVPIGVSGQLFFGGSPVVRGYLDRPEATAEKFLPDAWSGEPGARLYATGDRARFLVSGDIEFLGRIDQQVKIRGFRVEPGEIETALGQHPGVREVAVSVCDDGAGSRRLVGYVVPTKEPLPTSAELRSFLKERLPEYMVPATFLWLDTLPLTPSGKLDRRALPSPEEGLVDRSREATAPRNPFEELLVGIWAELLRVEWVGIEDNFFDLGGHSLLATRVISRIREAFGVTLPVRSLFDRPTVSRLAEAIAEALKAGTSSLATPLEAMVRVGPLPLSFAQQRLWFLDQLVPGSSAYNISHALVLAGELNVPALWSSVAEVVRRHEVLRTTFAIVGGEPVARVGAAEPPALPLVDLWGLQGAAWEVARRLARQEAGRPFDLMRGPLLRLVLVRLGESSHALLSTMHHIVSDGWSTGILIRELSALYQAFLAGRGSPLPELPIQYADFAVWQRGWLSGEVLEGELAYWRRQLAGAPPVLELPTDRPRPAVRRGRGAREAFALPAESLAGLRALAREQGATLFMGLLAGFAALLWRYSGQGDVTIGTPIAGRTRVEVEWLIGFFVNTLVVRVDLSGDPSFVEQLHRVREVSLGAYAHQELPFERLVEELEPVRDLGRTPLFQAMFVLQNAPREELEIEGLRFASLELENDTAKLDLTLSMVEGGGGLHGSIEYDIDLFDRSTIRRLVGHLGNLLSGALAAPQTAWSALPLQNLAERHQLLVEWNDTAAAVAGELFVHRWIARQAELSPEAVAVVSEGSELSYGELESRSNRLGRHLRRLGVGPEVVVGICAERSVELLVGLLGILKAGGAYLPLDPSYPAERLLFMVEDGLKGPGQPVLLVERRWAEIFAGWSARTGACQVELGEVWEQAVSSSETFEDGASAENLAYVIYTSGSTGRPKGVQIRHGALAKFLSAMLEVMPIVTTDRLLAVASLSFDMAGFELYLPLVSGACVVLAPREVACDGEQLLDRLVSSDITAMCTTPATWRLLLAAGWKGKGRLKIMCGGEALPDDLAVQLLDEAGALWNGYGPTEATIASIVQRIHEGERITIGRPLANAEVYLLSRRLTPVALGSHGELYIGGASVARGYGRRPELTAERFIPDPFTGTPGARLYKTGDLARWLPEGQLDFLGRVDHQMKVRGFRIELGEIESVLLEHPGVGEAVVLACEDRPGDRRLTAYLVPVGDRFASEALRVFLKERLPEYMVPAAFLWLDALPLTPNGKVDRWALPAPEEGAGDRAGEAMAPRNSFEELLAGIWAETLRVERVGIEDNFFDLGGHSLLAMRVISRIREAFGVALPVRSLFDCPTVSRLAEAIVEALRAGKVSSPPPLAATAREGLLPLSFAQRRLWFLDQLEPGNAAYNIPLALRIEGRLDPRCLAWALSTVVARHEVLRTTFHVADGEPVQVIAPAAEVGLPMIDLGGMAEPLRAPQALDLAAREAARPFDLTRDPLLRLTLLQLGQGEHMLFLTLHHIAADGESLMLLVEEASALYVAQSRGNPPQLPELPMQYADYASWQRRLLQGEALQDLLAYWRRQLAGGCSPLRLPIDHQLSSRRTHRGMRHPFHISPPLTAAIRAFCAEESASQFMFLLAALAVSLSCYAGDDEVMVGVDLASRPRLETAKLIGFFINMLVMRTDLSGDPSFRELLRRVREMSLGALAHQDMPYEVLVEELRPERTAASSPLFQVVLNFSSSQRLDGIQLLETAGLRMNRVEHEDQLVRFDLMLQVIERKGEFRGAWVFSTELFKPTTIESLHRRFMALVGRIVECPDAPLSVVEAEATAYGAAAEEQAWLEASWRQVSAVGQRKVRAPSGRA
jgi:amino acid adenylation domain-containing protein